MIKFIVYDTTTGDIRWVRGIDGWSEETVKEGNGTLQYFKDDEDKIFKRWTLKSNDLADIQNINDKRIRIYTTSSIRTKMNFVREKLSDSEIMLKYGLLPSRPRRKPGPKLEIYYTESEEGPASFVVKRLVLGEGISTESKSKVIQKASKRFGNDLDGIVVNTTEMIGEHKWYVDVKKKKLVRKPDIIYE